MLVLLSLNVIKQDIGPNILFNYIETEQDKQDWRDCIRLTREILSQKALEIYSDGEIQPGNDINSDAEIDAWVRANVESAYHASCTCKMGADNDPMAIGSLSAPILQVQEA